MPGAPPGHPLAVTQHDRMRLTDHRQAVQGAFGPQLLDHADDRVGDD